MKVKDKDNKSNKKEKEEYERLNEKLENWRSTEIFIQFLKELNEKERVLKFVT